MERMRGFGTTVFAEMSALARRTGAVNLGQGFPDSDGPSSLLADAAAAIAAGRNQYPPGPGEPELLEAVAAHQQRFHGLSVDPATEVLVTAGATEAIAASVLALCGPGDEVVVLEPAYDAYAAVVALAGAVQRSVALRPGGGPGGGFALDAAALRAAVTDRTRLLLLNTPHNPTGTVLGSADLAVVAEVARAHDLVVVTDEVYEHLVYDGARHVPLATLPGMAERTLTVSSAGKTFSVTGWKIGWVHGPAELVTAVRTVKQFLTYTGGAPFQPAVARALALPAEFFTALSAYHQRRRDLLVEVLLAAGMAVAVPSGGFFVVDYTRPIVIDDGDR